MATSLSSSNDGGKTATARILSKSHNFFRLGPAVRAHRTQFIYTAMNGITKLVGIKAVSVVQRYLPQKRAKPIRKGGEEEEKE